MFKITARVCAAAALLASLGSACARGGKGSETAQRAKEANTQLSRADTLRATIDSVDPENRAVTLRDAGGQPFTVLVGDEVDIDRLKPNDEVRVTYQESLDLALLDPASRAAQDPGTSQQATRSELPDGVQFGRQVKTTVQIVAVAPHGTSATIRVPDGELRTVEVDDPSSRKKVSHLRPGDAVEVTYTEKLALAVADPDEH